MNEAYVTIAEGPLGKSGDGLPTTVLLSKDCCVVQIGSTTALGTVVARVNDTLSEMVASSFASEVSLTERAWCTAFCAAVLELPLGQSMNTKVAKDNVTRKWSHRTIL